MIAREVRLLMKKEWAQLRANRTALSTSLMPPILFLALIPNMLVATMTTSPIEGGPPPLDLGLIGDAAHDPARLPIFILPLFVGLAGITVPIVLATHSVVGERETRTFEMLIALPVRLGHVLQAKLLTVAGFTGAVSAGFLTITVLHLALRGMASVLEVLALYLELFAAIAAGSASALMVGFLSKDFRTAQNVSAAYVIPVLFASITLSLLVGGGAIRPLVLACAYGLWAAMLAAHAARQNSFEQLMR